MAKTEHAETLELEPGEDLLAAIKRAFANATKPEPVAVEPDLTGPSGRAWIAPTAEMRAKAAVEDPDFGPADGLLAAWVVEAPKEGNAIHSYWVSLADLSNAQDEITRTGATHEFVVFPITPGFQRNKVLVDAEKVDTLPEPIYAAQLICASHAEAGGVLKALIMDVIAGKTHLADEDAMIARFGADNVRSEARDNRRITAARERFDAAKHGVEIGAAIVTALEPGNATPAMLRAGLDMHGASIRALLKLLVDKGVISKAEIAEAVAEQTEEEVKRYQRDAGLPRTVKLNTKVDA